MRRPMADRPQKPALRHRHALSAAEDDRVRSAVRKLVEKHGSQSDLARALDVSPTTISRHLAGFQAGPDFAALVAKASGTTRDDLIGRAPQTRTEPRLRDLPGWEEAEATARSQFRFVPSAAWDAVGDLRTAKPPAHVTSEWIGGLASHWARVLSGEGDETEALKVQLAALRASRVKPKT